MDGVSEIETGELRQTTMPTELPQRRSRGGLYRWQIAGIAIGYLAITGAMLWVAVERAGVTDARTPGIAISVESGRPPTIK